MYRAQDDADDEDDDDYVEVTLKIKAKSNFKASVVKVTKFAGLSALLPAGELSLRVGKCFNVMLL